MKDSTFELGLAPTYYSADTRTTNTQRRTVHTPIAGHYQKIYRKIPIIRPGLIFVQKAVLLGLISGGAYFRRGLLLEGILRFKMGWA